MSLRHWQQMGGVNINEGLEIDNLIHKTMNSRSAVLKVKGPFCLECIVPVYDSLNCKVTLSSLGFASYIKTQPIKFENRIRVPSHLPSSMF